MVENRKPEHSEVSNIAFEDYDSDVMKTESYAQICSAIQLKKAIPVLLEIRDGMNAVRKTGDETLNEIKAVRKNTDAIPQVLDDLPGYASNFRQMQSDIRAIKDRLGMS